ncbi:MAG: helix-turn-helix transcriptional regulator [Spirosomataceae bacterium]
MIELMYDLAYTDKTFLTQILQLRNQPVQDLSFVLDVNYTNRLSVNDLARLSGRSLSTFKREFQQIYNTSPAQWIREKRLHKAKELLEKTEMNVTDVCFTTGFESIAHFSRTFKSYFGIAPSSVK